MDWPVRSFRIVLLLISGGVALTLVALRTIENGRNYDGLTILLSLPGAVVAIVAYIYVYRRGFFTIWEKIAGTFNFLALAYWLFWIGAISTFWVFAHEPGSFKRTFDQIKPGMTLVQVEALMDPLHPKGKRIVTVPQHSLRHISAEATGKYLTYYAPNAWKYCFYLGEHDTVVKTSKWWD